MRVSAPLHQCASAFAHLCSCMSPRLYVHASVPPCLSISASASVPAPVCVDMRSTRPILHVPRQSSTQ
eukprot:15439483-Alexandrium_andersonii.AAC.1